MSWNLYRLTGATEEGGVVKGDLPEPETPDGGTVGLVGLEMAGGGWVGLVVEE